jgi:hypothetical protein
MENNGYELPINFVDYLSEISPSSVLTGSAREHQASLLKGGTISAANDGDDLIGNLGEALQGAAASQQHQNVDVLTAVEIVFYVLLTLASVGCNAVVLAVILKRRTFHSPTNG